MRTGLLPFVTLVLAGCAGGGGVDSPAKSTLGIGVGALQIEGVSDASYTITVENALGETVWTQSGLTSQRYGDGQGALSYVGACDASAGANPNTVTLTIDSISRDGAVVDADEWVNPTPIQREVVCLENGDAAVRFDLTVMFRAHQGFFDIGVNFADIFCSAKLDCVDELLHHDDGTRGPTAVVAFACTSGLGQDTTLYWGDAAIVCDGDSTVEGSPPIRYAIDPGLAQGQHGPLSGTGAPVSGGVYEYAIYRDSEDFLGVDKCFWNLAIGLAPSLGRNCRFVATATAASERWTDLTSPDDQKYPIISWDVQLTNSGGVRICGENPLDAVGSGVVTGYTELESAGTQFAVGAGCGEEPYTLASNGFMCTGDVATVADAGFTSTDDGRVTFRAGGAATAPMALPAGLSLASSCCAEPCCGGNTP